MHFVDYRIADHGSVFYISNAALLENCTFMKLLAVHNSFFYGSKLLHMTNIFSFK